MPKTINIDIETFSDVDLTKSGVYKYSESKNFKILIACFSLDGGPVQVVGPDNIKQFASYLADETIIKKAWNAAFEMVCLGRFFKISPSHWDCTMIRAARLGLPMALASATKVLNVTSKLGSGSQLIRYFSIPQKDGSIRTPEDSPERWRLFVEYCIQDVAAESAAGDKMIFNDVPLSEATLWRLDFKINSLGVRIDRDLVDAAIYLDEINTADLTQRAKRLTGLENPNSIAQLKAWLGVDSLTKANVSDMIDNALPGAKKQVLELRAEMAKSSIKKYIAMEYSACADDRVKGTAQFYGASRTGRWSGRLVQLQNLPRNNFDDETLDRARELVKKRDLRAIKNTFGSVADTLSQVIRTAFIPAEGKKFIVADFSAIEARVIAWLAGEKWRLDVFETHGKIYEASAAKMFNVPIESIGKDSDLRRKGKVSELALGYQGGVNALIAMGALDMGIPEKELQHIVTQWRKSSPSIVKLWLNLEQCFKEAVKGAEAELPGGLVSMEVRNDVLFLRLPSKRELAYQSPGIGSNGLYFWGLNQTTKRWEKIDMYGGKITENVIQAIARDCLAEAMWLVDKSGYDIVMHVHDEIVIEALPEDKLEDVVKIMSRPLPWAPGLKLTADGFESDYYKK